MASPPGDGAPDLDAFLGLGVDDDVRLSHLILEKPANHYDSPPYMSSDGETFIEDYDDMKACSDTSIRHGSCRLEHVIPSYRSVGPTPALFPTLSRPNYVDPASLACLPEPPVTCILFDPTSNLDPLEAYDETTTALLQNPTSSPPSFFSDAYLIPGLANNERDRLTALWYYTHDIHHDKVFLAHIQDTLEFIHELVPRDCIFLSLSDKDTVNRIAGINIPLAITNRKETLCSHTINMPVGTVLSLDDIKNDWRFAKNPVVANGGIGSYIGVPLHFSVPNQDGSESEVALGSLCATSADPSEPLTPMQQKTILRFAKMIVHDIVARARTIRANERQIMASTLANLAAEVSHANASNLVLGTLLQTYPNTSVSIQQQPKGLIQLNGGTPVSYTAFQNYIYEDTEQIDRDLLQANHVPDSVRPPTGAIRAMAVRLAALQDSYLVVQTSRTDLIFDDIDSNFVHTCALILSNATQAAEIERAAAAKAVFLRGVSHELRTPIHALLSSCELLVEEVKIGCTAVVQGAPERHAAGTSMESVELLDNALASGRALLATVNNLLNFDTLESITPIPVPFSLAGLEVSLVDQTVTALRDKSAAVEIICVHALPLGVHLLNTDLDLLKQALTAVVDNAVAYTTSGTITLRTSLAAPSGPDGLGHLVYDVIDTGSGIPVDQQADVFTPFGMDQRNPSKSPRLGLAVASRIAATLGGRLDLVRSGPNGSHFRLYLRAPILSGLADHPCTRLFHGDIHTFGVMDNCSTAHIDAARESFNAVGMAESSVAHSSFLVADADIMASPMALVGLDGDQCVLVFCKDEDSISTVSAIAAAAGVGGRLVAVLTPMTAERMWIGMDSILDLVQRAKLKPAHGDESSEHVTSTLSSSSSRSSFHGVSLRPRPELRILVVDDNKTNLDILCMFCRRRKHDHLSAINGALAVEAFKKAVLDAHPVALVLMDLQMPIMDGAEATRLIRAYEAEQGLRPCLIHMVSGQSYETDKLRAIEAGADGYYVKPLSMRTLDDLIDLHFPTSRT